MNDELKAGVGLSRKWDAREAGREVAETTLEKLDGEKPKFFLLFSTIHYEKYGGFQELLNGVWDVLPEGKPLIGGTVAGFMNNYGCYTRGATALAVSYPNMDVAIGVGHNTKKNPKKAGRQCALMIKKKLDESKFKNKFLVSIISGAKTLSFPGIGRKRVVNVPTGSYISSLVKVSTTSLQYGVARSKDIFKELDQYLKDFYIIGGEATDNNEVRENFQFAGKEVFSSEIVAMGISTNFDINLASTYDVGPKTRHEAKVTKRSCWNHIICSINGKPAKKELLRLLGWPEEYIDERIYRRVFFYPLGYSNSSTISPHVIGAFWGDYIIFEYPIEDTSIGFHEYSGRTLRNSLETTIEKLSGKKHHFGLGAACISSLETLGKSTYIVQDELSNLFEDSPFIFLYMAGEDVKYPNRPTSHMNYSFNMLTMG